MPNIPFPSVPAYPGVPAIPREVGSALATIAIDLGTLSDILGNSLEYASEWGIYDKKGNRLGLPNGSLSKQIGSQFGLLPSDPVQSTLSFDFLKEARVSDFPIEGGSFAAFNKVETPANPVVTLALSGSEDDRSQFLAAIDEACKSTDLYNVLTPEITYVDYSIERYVYQRRSQNGATLLIVDISLKEIRRVSAIYTTVTPIVAPQSASAANQIDNGVVQAQAPDVSTLKSIMQKLGVQ